MVLGWVGSWGGGGGGVGLAQPVTVNGTPMNLPILIAATTPSPAPTATPGPTPAPSPTSVPSPIAHFSTLVPHAILPSESVCANQVNAIPMAEVVELNTSFNTAGQIPSPSSLAAFHSNPQPFKGDTQGIPADYQFADGNFFGSTDMLIRNAACKWGIDEDVIRAEAQNESGGWLQKGAGDKQTLQSSCVQASYPNLAIWNTTVSQPGGFSVSCPSCCYQSWGITQNKLFYEPTAFPMAVGSTAFTLDLTYAKIRSCMNGNYSTYFASSGQQPNTYSSDTLSGNLNRILWGCVGMHFSGSWYDSGAQTYISEVQTILAARSWPGGTTQSPSPTPVPSATPTPGGITSTNCPQPSVCSSVTCPTSTNWKNPLDFGAIGDGTHNDTAAIQSANNAGDVCFPSGHTFLVAVPGSGASISIGQNGRHWQAGMIGGAAPILKQSGVPSHCATNDQCVLTRITSSGGSVIGLDFEGPYHNSTTTYNEWDMAIRAEGAANNWLAAGNTFNGFGGDGEIELVGSFGAATPCITGWRTAYNSFNYTGNYGFVVVAGQHNEADHNTTLEGAEGVENDNTSECTGGNTFNLESLTANVGAAWQVTTGRSHYTCLTGGCTAANYSGNTVSNSTVTGSQSCVCKSASGGTPAAYTNVTCANGCQTR